MFIKQLSVFIENREGRLEQVIKTLQDNKISIITLSLADTSEYGMLRLIVDNPEEGKWVLKENGFSAMLTDVLAVKINPSYANFNEVLDMISAADLNIEYMYSLSSFKDNPAVIIKLSDPEKTEELVKSKGIKVYDSKEVYKLK